MLTNVLIEESDTLLANVILTRIPLHYCKIITFTILLLLKFISSLKLSFCGIRNYGLSMSILRFLKTMFAYVFAYYCNVHCNVWPKIKTLTYNRYTLLCMKTYAMIVSSKRYKLILSTDHFWL